MSAIRVGAGWYARLPDGTTEPLAEAGDDIRNGEARALEERAAAEAKLAAEAKAQA